MSMLVFWIVLLGLAVLATAVVLGRALRRPRANPAQTWRPAPPPRSPGDQG